MGALIGQDAGFSLLVPATKPTHIHGVASKQYREGETNSRAGLHTERRYFTVCKVNSAQLPWLKLM